MWSDNLNLKPLVDLLQLASTLLLAVTGACYVTGLLIVNLEMARFGAPLQQFNRTEYVVAGAVFLFLLAAAHVVVSWTLPFLKAARFHWNKGRRAQAALLALTAPIIYPMSLLLVLMAVSDMPSTTLLRWQYFVSVAFLLGSAMYFRRLAWGVRKARDRAVNPNPELPPPMPLSTSLLWMALQASLMGFFVITLYTLTTFPYIGSEWGGGLRRPVTLIPTQRGAQIATVLHLPIKDTGEVGPLYLLLETDNELWLSQQPIQRAGATAVRLRRDLVEAIQPVSRERRPASEAGR